MNPVQRTPLAVRGPPPRLQKHEAHHFLQTSEKAIRKARQQLAAKNNAFTLLQPYEELCI